MANQTHSSGLSHEKIETNNFLMIVLILVAVAFGGLVEIVPLFFQKSTTQPIEGVKPYTALQLAGRDVYIREGCYNCHSQMIRPIWAETERYGEYSKPGEFVYDHPYQWGSRRIGPDLAREGVNNPNALWHIRHFENPRQMKPQSIMPVYGYLLSTQLDFDAVQSRVDTMKALGVPYHEEATKGRAAELAKAQAKVIAEQISSQGGPAGLEDKQVTALIAYLQRLGTDINKPAPTAAPAGESKKTASAGVASKGATP